MAQVSFAPDHTPSLDRTLDDVGARAVIASKPIRCRLQPQLYDPDSADYKSWQGLVWTVDLDSVEEGRRLREGITVFFRLFGGAEQTLLLTVLEELHARR